MKSIGLFMANIRQNRDVKEVEQKTEAVVEGAITMVIKNCNEL